MSGTKEPEKKVEETKPEETKPEDKKLSEMTPEEIKAQEEVFLSTMFPTSKPKPKPKEEEKKEQVEEPKVETKVEHEPEKKVDVEPEKKVEAKPVTLPPDIDDFKASKVKSQPKPEPEKKPVKDQDIESLLTKGDKNRLQVFKRMGKMDSKYASLSDDYLGYLKKEAGYIQKWLDENPGEEFDPGADEHRNFYSRNAVKWDEDDFDEAKTALIKEDATNAARNEYRRDLEKQSKEQKLKESLPHIAHISHQSALDFLTKADAENGKLIKSENGMLSISEQDLKRIEDEEPLVFEVLQQEVEPLRLMVGEIERFAMLPGDYKPDMEATVRLKHQDLEFPVHKEVINFLAAYEAEQLKRPADETMRDGKALVSNIKLADTIETIEKDHTLSADEKRRVVQEIENRYYSLGADDFRAALVEKRAANARKKIEKIRSLVPRKQPQKKEDAPAVKTATVEKTQEQPKKMKSPSMATVSDKTDTRSEVKSSSEEEAGNIVNRIMAR